MAKAAVKPAEAIVDFEAIKKEVADNPIILFMDASKLIAYLAALRDEVEQNPGDVGTAKGRDTIKANAAEIGRKKSAIDKERLRKTEEWRSMTATVNAAGKAVTSLSSVAKAPVEMSTQASPSCGPTIPTATRKLLRPAGSRASSVSVPGVTIRTTPRRTSVLPPRLRACAGSSSCSQIATLKPLRISRWR